MLKQLFGGLCGRARCPQRAAVAGLLMGFAAVSFAATPTITGVTAQQRYPWNGKVDLVYTVAGDVAAEAAQRGALTSLKVSAIDIVENTTNVATQLSGDMSLSEGTHAIVWDLDAEGLSIKSSNIVFMVECKMVPAKYCVIDLSSGANASSYPIVYMHEPPNGGFNTDEYKKAKLVLRRIEAGSFTMTFGGEYNVSLTKPFLCGIFQLTQKQYSLIMGSNPSGNVGDMRPVEKVSYDMLRGTSNGAKWPLSHMVDSPSFIGKLRARTGLEFDLPTEAQWEYACRAGTTSLYNNGGNSENDLKQLGRYSENQTDGKGGYSSKHTTVGSYLPNAWGLYDMHGNVWEWCLDWSASLTDGITDPVGADSGSQRILRGGCWKRDASHAPSGNRNQNAPSTILDFYGFRIARTLPDCDDNLSSESHLVTIDVTNGIRSAAHEERIRFSTDWGRDESSASGDLVIISVNGESLASVSGTGYVDWTPERNGTYILTHKMMSGDEQIGETLTATFFVEPANPEIIPESGTTFDSSLTVSMSCPTDGATIYYTTNGVDPTVESAVYKRFRIYGKTTVKAIAEKDGMLSEVVTAEYALGQCADPVISLADGAEFAHSNQVVSIRWNNDGVLRYTLDGSEPTAESPVYEGPFSFSDSVVIKAKVFSDDFFDSTVVTSSLTRVWENVATPVIDASSSFMGSKTKVVITCATEGATIRYTLNGNDPNSHSTKYTGPFYVTDSCTVKAYAVMADYLNSAVATQEIVKVWGIGDSLGKPDHGFTTDGSAGAGWVRVVDATAPNGEAMKSGAITHSQTSTLSTTVMGPGTLTFSWMTSCEEDPDGRYEWDHAEFSVDGNVQLRRDGVNSWQQESVRIEGGGEHTVTWVYKKDEVESEGDDAAWVAGYGWVSDLAETQTTDVHVPYAWLLGHDPEIVDEYDAYESAAKLTGENGHKVWESYAIGANPNDKDDVFKITSFPMKADGTPDFDAITISPPQTQWNVQGATPMLKGKATLDGGEWQMVTDENKADMRFFKVEVVLP